RTDAAHSKRQLQCMFPASTNLLTRRRHWLAQRGHRVPPFPRSAADPPSSELLGKEGSPRAHSVVGVRPRFSIRNLPESLTTSAVGCSDSLIEGSNLRLAGRPSAGCRRFSPGFATGSDDDRATTARPSIESTRPLDGGADARS